MCNALIKKKIKKKLLSLLSQGKTKKCINNKRKEKCPRRECAAQPLLDSPLETKVPTSAILG